MPRKIGENLRNDLKIWDPVSDSAIIFFYRLPTTAERIQYENDSYELVEGKITHNITKSRQKWGPEILTGFREGCFQKKVNIPSPPACAEASAGRPQGDQTKSPPPQGEGEGGGGSGSQWVPFSSDPSSPNYDPEWKSLVQKYASDLIETLAAHVFEGARAFSSQEENPGKN